MIAQSELNQQRAAAQPQEKKLFKKVEALQAELKTSQVQRAKAEEQIVQAQVGNGGKAEDSEGGGHLPRGGGAARATQMLLKQAQLRAAEAEAREAAMAGQNARVVSSVTLARRRRRRRR